MRIFILAALLLAVQPFSHAQAPPRPNVIVIMTDDQNADTIAHMPILQARLVAEGMTFENAYTVTPLCCPSRVSILTGRYIHNHSVVFNYGDYGGFQRAYSAGVESATLATWLQASGYHTALVGKYLNGYPQSDNPTYVPPGWDEWYAQRTPTEADDYYYNYTLIENGAAVQYGASEADYMTDVLADKAVSIIEGAAVTGQPFFIHINPFAPHYPYTSAPRHEGLFKDTKLPKPPSFNELDVSDKPSSVRNKPRLEPAEVQELTAVYRHQLRTLQSVDEMIGRVIDTLGTHDLLDNTYIVYLTDNGYHLGTHRLKRGKSRPYVEDLRVPLIVRGTGIPAGVTDSRLVATIDLAPTIAEWAGITPPDVDGRSLVPLFTAAPTDWRTVLLTSFICPGGDYPTRVGCFNGLITETSTYTEYPVTGEVELYGLTNDPYQLDSLHASTPQTILDRYATRLKRLLQCSGVTCRTLDDWNVP